jgi:hypothetical protein
MAFQGRAGRVVQRTTPNRSAPRWLYRWLGASTRRADSCATSYERQLLRTAAISPANIAGQVRQSQICKVVRAPARHRHHMVDRCRHPMRMSQPDVDLPSANPAAPVVTATDRLSDVADLVATSAHPQLALQGVGAFVALSGAEPGVRAAFRPKRHTAVRTDARDRLTAPAILCVEGVAGALLAPTGAKSAGRLDLLGDVLVTTPFAALRLMRLCYALTTSTSGKA